ncbi:hypothetical protein [Rhodococcoides fascians]|uniref:Uncharacterized protein n=1 Tax=Rhodococcoides fascians TaxID=1828 RepID=A0A143QSB6_RHOFA|nr:hypothetical protein [Rhodococcus fascians]AMY25412.1 hypothetical protein A3Q41_04131 [Rhodococcus fascians]OZC39886.1 hypothetical protein CHX23_13305 [Rhodococcus fascians]
MSTDLAPSTATWVLEHLEPGERVTAVDSMTGGITAEVRRLTVADDQHAVRVLVLKGTQPCPSRLTVVAEEPPSEDNRYDCGNSKKDGVEPMWVASIEICQCHEYSPIRPP